MSQNDNLLDADGTEEVNETIDTSNNTEATTQDDAVINEIDEANAEDAEDTGNSDRHTVEEKDYSAMSLETLANELETLVNNEKIQAIKKPVEGIKNEFTEKFNALLEEKKEEFLAEGGNIIDFHYSSPTQKKFKDTFKGYRSKLNAYYKGLEKDLKGNLVTRTEIIEEIKALIDLDETMNTKYKQFKDLQDRWRSAGAIPRDKYNNTWNNYHFNVERFYDLLHLDRDLRDKDFARNLEKKTKIIERAEALAQEPDTNSAFRELQNLHKLWKEDLGPVAREHRDAIWDRFKDATKIINDKRQEHFAQLDEVYERNLEFKNGVIGLIEEKTAEAVNASHKGWQTKIKEIEMLREEFFNGGKVPGKVNEATWAKFKGAVRDFNRKKNEFYKSLKNDQYDNLKKKLALIDIAEANKDSDDFSATTALMKKIQGDWKAIGHVPRKDSDKIWKQFKGSCNHYFDRIKELRNASTEEEEAALVEKEALLETVKNTTLSGEQKADLATIKGFIAQWKAIGRVPNKKRKVESDFNSSLDGLFKSLDMNKAEVEMIKFDNRLQDLSSSSDPRLLENELVFIKKKMSEIKGEIIQLENNLLFFKHADEKNPLVKSVYTNIKKHEEELTVWSSKAKKIKAIFKAEEKAKAEKAAAEAEAAANEAEDATDSAE